MNQFMKRCAALALSAAIICSALPWAAAAEKPDFQAILTAGESNQNAIYSITDPTFTLSQVSSFVGEYAVYQDFYNNSGILDCRGNIVFAARDEIQPKAVLDDGLFVSTENYLYDFQGNRVYDQPVYPMDCGLLRDLSTGALLGYRISPQEIGYLAVGLNGEQEDGVFDQPRNGLVCVMRGNLYGLKTLFGEEITPVEYDYLEFVSDDCLFFSKDGVNGLLSTDGTVKQLLDYDSVRTDRLFSHEEPWHGKKERCLIVSKDGKTGVLNADGSILVPLEYDSIFIADDDLFPFGGTVDGVQYHISLDDSLRFCGSRNFPSDCVVLSGNRIVLRDENGHGILVNQENERLLPETLASPYVRQIGSVWAMQILETGTTRLYDSQLQLVAELDGYWDSVTDEALVFQRTDGTGGRCVEYYGADGSLLHRYEGTVQYWNRSEQMTVLRRGNTYAFTNASGALTTDFIYRTVLEISSGWDGLHYPFCLVSEDGGSNYQILDGRTGQSILPAGAFVTDGLCVIREGSFFAYFKDGKTGFAKLASRDEPFLDVTAGVWYSEPVSFCFNAGLMRGTGGGLFSPDAEMTRAMVVQVLYAICREAAEPYGFSDVPDGAWFADAVNWAAANGIVAGIGNGQFAPNLSITREQLVAILFKYASTYGECRGDESILASYRDLSSVSDYARIPFAWAVKNGMISGTSADTLSPQSTATRAQIATVMRRFIQYMASQP